MVDAPQDTGESLESLSRRLVLARAEVAARALIDEHARARAAKDGSDDKRAATSRARVQARLQQRRSATPPPASELPPPPPAADSLEDGARPGTEPGRPWHRGWDPCAWWYSID